MLNWWSQTTDARLNNQLTWGRCFSALHLGKMVKEYQCNTWCVEDQVIIDLSSTNSKSRLERGRLSQLCSVGRSVKWVPFYLFICYGVCCILHTNTNLLCVDIIRHEDLRPKSFLMNTKDMYYVLKSVFQGPNLQIPLKCSWVIFFSAFNESLHLFFCGYGLIFYIFFADGWME